MKTEFDITLSGKDMYRFALYHAYTGLQGIVSILIAVLCLIAAGAAYGARGPAYAALYAGFGILFLVYVPANLYLRSKRQIQASDVLKNALHYVVDEAGIHASQNEASADLPWEQVYKAVSTASNVLIYSSRINAYIIPKSQIAHEYESLREIARQHLPAYRFKIK